LRTILELQTAKSTGVLSDFRPIDAKVYAASASKGDRLVYVSLLFYRVLFVLRQLGVLFAFVFISVLSRCARKINSEASCVTSATVFPVER